MNRNLRRAVVTAVCTIILLICQGAAWAQSGFPAGTYTYEFSGNISVWDVSGTYSDSSGGINMTYTLNVDGKGKITGAGQVSAYLEGVDVEGDLTLTGSITASGSTTRVTLSLRMTGTASYEGNSYRFTATAGVGAGIDSASEEIVGTESIHISLAGHSASEKASFDVGLPSGVDGTWSVPITVSADSKGRISGTATIEISGGDDFSFSVTGTYTAKKGVATITCKGVDAASRAESLAMTLQAAPNNLAVKSLAGTLLGQKVTKK